MNLIQRSIARLLGLPIPLSEEDKAKRREEVVAKFRTIILGQLEGTGVIPPGMELVEVAGTDIPGLGVAKQLMLRPKRPGIEPPADDQWSWAKWLETVKGLKMDSWAVCRFGNRTGPDRMEFVFGIAKDDFGVWEAPLPVCVEHPDPEFCRSWDQTTLASLTYLPSGLGVAIFNDRETAARAADLAGPIMAGIDFDAPDIDATWPPIRSKLHETWRFHGIREDQYTHCHHMGASEESAPVWCTDDTTEDAKPEKLS